MWIDLLAAERHGTSGPWRWLPASRVNARSIIPAITARARGPLKYPMPHVIIGRYNPHEQIDEEGTGQPSYFKVLRTCQNGLSLAGECTYSVAMSAATIKLSYALAEDAARVCALVSAVPARVVGDCARLAYFNYDRPLYNRLRAIRDDRTGAITAAYERGEVVKHAHGSDDPR
jgi:hypothetical protein